MKKITLIALAFVTANAYAQLPVSTAPQKKKAVLEEYTGINCQYCPDGHRIADNMKNADPTNVFLVNIHTGGFAVGTSIQTDFTTAEGNAINAMPGMGTLQNSFPSGMMNREQLVGNGLAASRSAWTSMANTIKAQNAYCNVAMQATLDPQTRVLTIAVEVYYTGSSPVTTNSLNVFLLENNIKAKQIDSGPFYPENFNSDGTYNHKHVLRKAITPTFGQTIPNTTSGTLYTTTISYTIPASYGMAGKTTVPNFENLELLAFVAESDRKIINANDGPIWMTNDAKAISAVVPGVACGGTVAPTVTIKNSGLATITNLTITPAVNNVVGNTTPWTGILAPNASTTIILNTLNATGNGNQTLTYTISSVAPADFYVLNNTANANFFAANNYQGAPVAEGFNFALFPPTGWASINPNKGPSFSRSTLTGGYFQSTQSTKYDFFTNKVINDIDELYLPAIDLSGTQVPVMSFDYAYAQRNSNSNDKLEVLISDDCGQNWTSVWSNSGTALSTAPPQTTSYLPDPNDFTQWVTPVLQLTGFNKNVIVKFRVTNDNGNNLYIDNINLKQSSPSTPVGISTAAISGKNVSIYPNPTSGVTTIDITSASTSEVKISVINAIGQLAIQKSAVVTEGNNSLSIDVRGLAEGVYSVVIDTKEGSARQKINVTK